MGFVLAKAAVAVVISPLGASAVLGIAALAGAGLRRPRLAAGLGGGQGALGATAMDALLAPKLPVIIPDMVRFEVIRDLSKPGARQVADWIRAYQSQHLRVVSTEVFEEFQVLLAARPGTKTAGRGEQAAATGSG